MELYNTYEYFGCHKINNNDYIFRVYAPGAIEISVALENQLYNMQLNEENVWEITISAQEGQKYQYHIKTQDNEILHKADPYSFYTNKEFSIIYDITKLKSEKHKIDFINQAYYSPLNIYEIFLAGWNKNYQSYREIAKPLAEYLKEYSYNAVQFMPIMEYPIDKTWGYQTTGYFTPTSRYGRPEDLVYLIDYLHENGIAVILDWTPAHFDPADFGLINFDGAELYEYPDKRYQMHPVWKTQIFNWSNPYVMMFLISSARFWLEVYGFDGLRVDTVTSLIQLFEFDEKNRTAYNLEYNQEGFNFIRIMNRTLKNLYPNAIFIAEETQGFQGITDPNGFNFSYKQGLGWSWDTGSFIHTNNFNGLTKPLEYQYLNNSVLTYGHDQIAKTNGFLLEQFKGNYEAMRVFYAYMMAFPGKKCLFMGNEYGQKGYWNYEEPLLFIDSADQKNYADFVKHLNKFYLEHPALYTRDYNPTGTVVIENNNDNKVLAFIRRNSEETLLCLFNFGEQDFYDYRINNDKYYFDISEIFNTRYGYYTNPRINNNEFYFNIPAQTGIFYKIR